LDIEIYVDRIASMQIDNMNAVLATIRAQILSQHQTTDRDLYLRTLDAAFIQEDKYFATRSMRILISYSQIFVMLTSRM